MIMNRFFRKWTFRIAACVLFVSASHADGISADKSNQLAVEVAEALSLVAGPKTELAVIHAEFGEFREKYIPGVPAGIGKYIDHSSVISDSPKKAVIDYRFGNAASDELVGKHFQLIGEIDAEDNISWSCYATDQIVIDHFPEQCLPEVEESSDAATSQIQTTDDLLGLFFPDHKLRKQVSEALSLAYGPKTELAVAHAESGNFERRPEIYAGTGRYIDSSSVTYDDSGLKATITYRYGNEADPEIATQKLLIIASIREDMIHWSCQPADENKSLNKHLPDNCQTEDQKRAAQIEAQEQANKIRAAELAALPREEALRRQVNEAMSTMAGIKTELSIIYAEHGDFGEKPVIDFVSGLYTEKGQVLYDDSGKQAIIEYQLGNEAWSEISGKQIQIIGNIAESSYGITWSCRAEADLAPYLPDDCQSE